MSPDNVLFNVEQPEGVETLPVPVELQEHPLAAPTRDISPMALMQQAIERGIDPAGLVTLSELAKEWEDRKAAKEFAAALSEFQRRCPSIQKKKGGPKVSKAGTERMYYYAPLGGPPTSSQARTA